MDSKSPTNRDDSAGVNRRKFVSGLITGGGAALVGVGALLPPAARAGGGSRCVVVRGPLLNALPDLYATVGQPEIGSYLLGLDSAMQELAALPIPPRPPFVQPSVSGAERQLIVDTVDAVLAQLVGETPPGEELSAEQIAEIRWSTFLRMRDFVRASEDDVDSIVDLGVPLNLASLPLLRTVGDAFVYTDAGGPNLVFDAPYFQQAQDDKFVKKAAIVAGIVLALVAFVAALGSIKMPNVGADKITPHIAGALRSPAVRTAFLTLLDTLKRAGATVAEKVAAIFDFLKTLWNVGALKEILKDVFSNLGWFDLVLTVLGIAAIFLTGGAAVIAKAGLAVVALAVAIKAAADEYEKVQREG